MRFLCVVLGWTAAALLALGIALAVAINVSMRLPAPLEAADRGAELDDVTLIVPGGARRERQRLVVAGDRIAEIGPARPKSGGMESPYAGAYVLPGLVDAHVHLPGGFPAGIGPDSTELTGLHALLYLAHGITTVRSLGDPFGEPSQQVRAALASGALAGPRLLTCGPLVDGGNPIFPSAVRLVDASMAESFVREHKAAGWDCLKVYDDLRPEVLAALRQSTRQHGMPLVGHVPGRVPFGEAELDDAQHLRGIPPAPEDGSLPAPAPLWLRDFTRLDEGTLSQRIDEALAQGTALTPTLAVQSQLARSLDSEAWLARPELALVPAWLVRSWHPERGIHARRRLGKNTGWLPAAFERMKTVVHTMHSAGVRIHSGTDTGAPGVVPGAALHEELALFVDSGLTPEEALEIASVTTPQALGIEGLGRLEVGAPADLVIFAEDPTECLEHLDTIVAVVADGRLYSRDVLDEQLAAYRERNQEFGPSRVAPAIVGGLLDGLLSLAPNPPTKARQDPPQAR